MAIAPSASYSLTARLQITNRPGMLGRVASAIGQAGGDIGAVDLVESQRDKVVRDITIKARDGAHGQQIVNRLRQVSGIRVVKVSDRTFLMHRSARGTTSPWPTRPASPGSASRSGTTGSARSR